jgi:glycosidase
MKYFKSIPISLLAGFLLLNNACIGQMTEPPSWTKKVVWYQIMVERFYNGDRNNDPTIETIRTDTSYRVPSDWQIKEWTGDWYQLSDWEKNYTQSRHRNFNSVVQLRRYGGDLQGILDKLNYLQELGITAIYLNPINDAPSLHKYDARSYHHVDVNFGPDPAGDLKIIAGEDPSKPQTWQWTSADKLFLQLVEEVHKRNMRIIIDYSWNHTGTEFWAWKDLIKNQEKSAFRDWYMIDSFDDPATPVNEFRYRGWYNVRSMPEIKKVQVQEPRINGLPYEGNINEGAKQHIFAVTSRWLAPGGDVSKGIDGFRLDVADQIPLGFWRDYHQFVKSLKPEAYLVGEIWWEKWPCCMMDPVPYVKGDVFDAVMFYQVYRPARSFFAATNNPISARQFADSLRFQWNRISGPVAQGMMNVSATHDSPRLLSCFNNPGNYKENAKPSDDRNYRTGKPDAETYRRVMMYLVHQFTTIGAPQIWNGDEMGMWGSDDPDCRKPLWWQEYNFSPENRNNFQKVDPVYDSVGFNTELFGFYKQLIHLRKANSVLSDGKFEFMQTEGDLLSYRRYDNDQQIIVLFNRGKGKAGFSIPSSRYTNLLTGKKFSGNSCTLDALSAVILKRE